MKMKFDPSIFKLKTNSILEKILKGIGCSFFIYSCIYASESMKLNGRNVLESSWNSEKDQRYFEQWTDLGVSQDQIAVDLVLTHFLMPNPLNLDTTSSVLSRRSVRFTTPNIALNAGNFDVTLGNGLVLSSMRNRELRWNNDMDGFLGNTNWGWGEAKIISAKPRNVLGERQEMIQAVDIELNPFEWNRIGGSWLITNVSESPIRWGAVRSDFYLPMSSFSFEFAAREHKTKSIDFDKLSHDFYEPFPGGSALYIKGESGIGNFVWMGEYKDYQDFEIRYGAPLNNPPSVAKEYDFSLAARKQLELNSSDEVGFHTMLGYQHPLEGVVRINWTKAWNHQELDQYEDVFLSLDGYVMQEYLWNIGAGVQEDNAQDHHRNIVGQFETPKIGNLSFQLILEHQWSERNFNKEKYFTQAMSLATTVGDGVTITPSFERLALWDQTKWWQSIQLDWKVSENHNTTFFVGRRREGKVCAGGVCVYKPAFEGIEWLLQSSF